VHEGLAKAKLLRETQLNDEIVDSEKEKEAKEAASTPLNDIIPQSTQIPPPSTYQPSPVYSQPTVNNTMFTPSLYQALPQNQQYTQHNFAQNVLHR